MSHKKLLLLLATRIRLWKNIQMTPRCPLLCYAEGNNGVCLEIRHGPEVVAQLWLFLLVKKQYVDVACVGGEER